MKLVDGKRMAHIDRITQEKYGIPGIVLMENAASAVYAALVGSPHTESKSPIVPVPGRREIPVEGHWVCVAGPGNNGGDALVVARHARIDRRDVRIVLLKGELGELAEIHRKSLDALGVPVYVWPDQAALRAIDGADLIVDGLFGTGLKPPLRPGAAGLVEAVNAAAGRVAALDIPSGVGDGFRTGHPAVRADLTCTISLPKRALYLPAARPLCGSIVVVSAGFPPELLGDPEIRWELADQALARTLYPRSPAEDYKGTRGRVGVFAGAPGTTGAAVLCSSAAARVGAGLVYLQVDPEVYGPVAAQLVSVMPGVCDPEDVEPGRFDALVVGPGWGARDREHLLERLVSSGVPGVLDADGLSVLAAISDPAGEGDGGYEFSGGWVLTPHPGELGRLLGISTDEVIDDPDAAVDEATRRYRAVVLFKSHVTIVASPDGRRIVVDGMNPYLGTGGAGDVLSGIVGGLLARGADPFAAAGVGAYIHARAGVSARERGWYLAEELLPYVSTVSAELQESAG